MNVSIATKNGVVSLELCGNDEREIAALTAVFNRSALNRAFRFRARPTKILKNGCVGAVVIDNDAYLTNKYLKSVGFFCYKNERGIAPNKKLDGTFYVRGNVVLYNRTNSNVYLVYKNAKIEKTRYRKTRPEDNGAAQRRSTYSVVQANKQWAVQQAGNIRKVSELDALLTY